MPGFDRTQEQVIAARNLETTLQGYINVAGQQTQATMELTALLRAKFAKAPSVFKAGSFLDYIYAYPLVGSDGATNSYAAFGVQSIFVIPILDSDVCRLRIYGPDSSEPVFCAYALAPSNGAKANIPASDFALIKTQASVANASNVSALYFNGLALITGTIDPVTGDVNESLDPSAVTLRSGSPDTFLNYVTLAEDIPCSGYSFIHLMGRVSGEDLLAANVTESGVFTSYALIK